MKKAKNEFPQTLLEAIKYFADADVAVKFLASMRWHEGVACPICHGKEVGFISTRRIWKCKACKKQFSVKTGSVMEDSPLGLDKWLAAIWMIVNDRNGVSSCEIGRSLGITQKSAWFLLHRIRLAMENGSFEKMAGTVEIDESYFGGEPRFMHRYAKEKRNLNNTLTKKPVLGIVKHGEEGGVEVRAEVIPNTRAMTMVPIIYNNVEPGSTIHTDCHESYKGLGYAYKHETVNQHLDRYIAEQSFRYNNRKESDADRFQKVLQSIGGKRLTYNQLIDRDTE